MHVFHHLFFVVVGEACAIPWPYRIYIAHIGAKIQKLAGLLHIHPVTGLILIEPFLPESPLRHVQVFGYADHILPGLGGGHGLAAIGTIQAIQFFPGFQVCGFGHQVKPPGRVLFQFGEKIPDATLVIANFLFK